MTNFVNKFEFMSEEPSCQQDEALISSDSFQEKMCQGIWWASHYLKVPLMVYLHNIFRLIFHRQPSCLKNLLNFDEHQLGCLRQYVYTFRTTILWSTLLFIHFWGNLKFPTASGVVCINVDASTLFFRLFSILFNTPIFFY